VKRLTHWTHNPETTDSTSDTRKNENSYNMINLEYQGSTASVILRLRQISELTNPKFLFELYNKNSRISNFFITPDVSLAPGLYQEFEFRNVATGATSGNFIGEIGEYLITIRDTEFDNPTVASASSILMYETMRVYGPELPTIDSYSATDTMTFSYYTGGGGN